MMNRPSVLVGMQHNLALHIPAIVNTQSVSS
jgi:hypothetical protein